MASTDTSRDMSTQCLAERIDGFVREMNVRHSHLAGKVDEISEDIKHFIAEHGKRLSDVETTINRDKGAKSLILVLMNGGLFGGGCLFMKFVEAYFK